MANKSVHLPMAQAAGTLRNDAWWAGPVVTVVVPWKDVVLALVGWKDGVHVGLGTLVMFVNVVLISGYTFGCHSFRHLIGGSVNSFSTATLGTVRFALWRVVTLFNERHMFFA